MSDFSLPPFKDPDRLRQAMTHKSLVQEYPDETADNERLEFSGGMPF